MRSPGLVVMVVAALAIVGYAFYVLSDPDPPRPQPRPAKVRAKHGKKLEAGEQARPQPRRPRSRGDDRGAEPTPRPTKAAGQPARPTPSPAPRPEPEISLTEARQQFADFLAELSRLEAEGISLESPQWVDYYKKGHDLLIPLQQHLDWQVPDEADELRKANEQMRAKLRVLEPGYVPPPTSPPTAPEPAPEPEQ